MAAISGRAREVNFRGLEQFKLRGGAGDIAYCVAGPRPYALEFANSDDVICLLLGDILSNSKFEDSRASDLVFESGTTAFHPRQGQVRVNAGTVRQGFIAFAYSEGFQAAVDDRQLGRMRKAGTRNNIQGRSIQHLCAFIRERLQRRDPVSPVEMQFIAGSIYVETMRLIADDEQAGALSDREFARLLELIDATMEEGLTCADIARRTNLPLRAIADGVRQRAGASLYQFVLGRRLALAERLLSAGDASIAEVAVSCGFSSQQHLTSLMAQRLGVTPARLRSGGRTA